MTTGHKGNRHPGLSGFQNHRHFLLCGIAPAALDSAEDFDSISIRRHSRMTRRTPSSYLSNYVRFKWGLLHEERCGNDGGAEDFSPLAEAAV